MPNRPHLDEALLDRLLEHYRHLHANPEVSLAEFATTDWLEARLTELGFQTHRVTETGLAGVLSNGDGPVVAFRADIDGLPVAEETGVDWASTNGAMHACGHDIHMACALGLAELFAANKQDWSGTLEIIFQPAEETVTGARLMTSNGLWDAIPHAEVVYGQHVWPIEVGQIELAPGAFFSTVDTYRIEVRGRGGHGSMPEKTIDTVLLCAAITMRLNNVVAREIGLHEKAVLTVGSIQVGSKENIVPETGTLLVSTRSYDEAIRQRLQDAIARICRAEAACLGAREPTVVPMYRASSIINDPDATAALRQEFDAAFGGRVATPANPMTASEDFGYLGEAIGAPSVFWVFGGYPADRVASGESLPTNHSASFLPEPGGSIRTGTEAALTAVWSRLGR